MKTKIPCPTCQKNGVNSEIAFDPQLLLSGAHFNCPVCQTSISLMPTSHQTYAKGLSEYQGYQAQTQGLKERGNQPI